MGGAAAPAPRLSLGSQLLFAFKESGEQLVCEPSLLELVPLSLQTRRGAFIPDSRSQGPSSRAAAAAAAEPLLHFNVVYSEFGRKDFLCLLLHLITTAIIIMTIIIKQ